MLDVKKLPQHIAIIMDGNGRWANQQGLPRIFGHRAGADKVIDMTQACCDLGINALTLYAFSWENWNRPEEEINFLMELLGEFLLREEPKLKANQVKVRAMGRIDQLPSRPKEILHGIIDRTKDFKRMTLTLALSYGGRQEIVDAVRNISGLVKEGKISSNEINEELFAKYLYMPDLPDLDLLIRTSGELRVSNFMLWQISYCEFYVTKKFWPDFNKEDLVEAIEAYQKRDRRFGRAEALK